MPVLLELRLELLEGVLGVGASRFGASRPLEEDRELGADSLGVAESGGELVGAGGHLVALVLELREPCFGLFAGGGFGLETLGVGGGRLLQLVLEAGAVLLVGRGECLRLGQLGLELLDRLLGVGACPLGVGESRGELVGAGGHLVALVLELREPGFGLFAGGGFGLETLGVGGGRLLQLVLEAGAVLLVGRGECLRLGQLGLELLDRLLGVGACPLGVGESRGELVGAGGHLVALVLELREPGFGLFAGGGFGLETFGVGGGRLLQLVLEAGAVLLVGRSECLRLGQLGLELLDRLLGVGACPLGIGESRGELVGAGGHLVALVLELREPGFGLFAGGGFGLETLGVGGGRLLQLVLEAGAVLLVGRSECLRLGQLGLELLDRLLGVGACGFAAGRPLQLLNHGGPVGLELRDTCRRLLALELELHEPGFGPFPGGGFGLETLGIGTANLLELADRLTPLVFHCGDLATGTLELLAQLLDGILGRLAGRFGRLTGGLGRAGALEECRELRARRLRLGELHGEVFDPCRNLVALALDPADPAEHVVELMPGVVELTAHFRESLVGLGGLVESFGQLLGARLELFVQHLERVQPGLGVLARGRLPRVLVPRGHDLLLGRHASSFGECLLLNRGAQPLVSVTLRLRELIAQARGFGLPLLELRASL